MRVARTLFAVSLCVLHANGARQDEGIPIAEAHGIVPPLPSVIERLLGEFAGFEQDAMDRELEKESKRFWKLDKAPSSETFKRFFGCCHEDHDNCDHYQINGKWMRLVTVKDGESMFYTAKWMESKPTHGKSEHYVFTQSVTYRLSVPSMQGLSTKDIDENSGIPMYLLRWSLFVPKIKKIFVERVNKANANSDDSNRYKKGDRVVSCWYTKDKLRSKGMNAGTIKKVYQDADKVDIRFDDKVLQTEVPNDFIVRKVNHRGFFDNACEEYQRLRDEADLSDHGWLDLERAMEERKIL